MSNNRIIIYITLGALILIIAIPSILKVVSSHRAKLYKSTITKIEEKASKCILEEKCSNTKITLQDLYDYGYLEKVVNPLTKEYFESDSYLIKTEDGFEAHMH